MMSKAHLFKNAMLVYAAELICSTRVLGFQIFKLVFCIHTTVIHVNCVYTLKFYAIG